MGEQAEGETWRMEMVVTMNVGQRCGKDKFMARYKLRLAPNTYMGAGSTFALPWACVAPRSISPARLAPQRRVP